MEKVIKFRKDEYSFAVQPIVNISTEQVVAHELLLRHFEGVGIDVYTQKPSLFVENILPLNKSAAQLAKSLVEQHEVEMLFVNFTPNQIEDVSFEASLSSFYSQGINPSQVAIEITEQHHPNCDIDFYRNIEMARGLGHPIVVDDFGAGIANFNHVTKIKPSIVKTDMSLIHEAEDNRESFIALKALVNFIKEIGSKVIIEGVETSRQYELAVMTGAHFCQGYYFGHPQLKSSEKIRPKSELAEAMRLVESFV